MCYFFFCWVFILKKGIVVNIIFYWLKVLHNYTIQKQLIISIDTKLLTTVKEQLNCKHRDSLGQGLEKNFRFRCNARFAFWLSRIWKETRRKVRSFCSNPKKNRQNLHAPSLMGLEHNGIHYSMLLLNVIKRFKFNIVIELQVFSLIYIYIYIDTHTHTCVVYILQKYCRTITIFLTRILVSLCIKLFIFSLSFQSKIYM